MSLGVDEHGLDPLVHLLQCRTSPDRPGEVEVICERKPVWTL